MPPESVEIKRKRTSDHLQTWAYLESKRRTKIILLALIGFTSVSGVLLGWVGIPALISRVPANQSVTARLSANQAQIQLTEALDRLKDPSLSQEDRQSRLNEVVSICEKFPVLRTQAEWVVFKSVLVGSSVSMRADSLRALSTFKSPRAFTMIDQLLKSDEVELQMAAVMGLESFIGTNRDPAARLLLLKTIETKPGEVGAMAARILIKHRDRRIASALPLLLRKDATNEERKMGEEVIKLMGKQP